MEKVYIFFAKWGISVRGTHQDLKKSRGDVLILSKQSCIVEELMVPLLKSNLLFLHI